MEPRNQPLGKVRFPILVSNVFQIFFLHSPLFGEDSHFDHIIFFKGVETTNQLKFKMVHLKINPGKEIPFRKKIMFRFHVKLSGCNVFFLRGVVIPLIFPNVFVRSPSYPRSLTVQGGPLPVISRGP